LVVGNPPFGKIESKNLLLNNDFFNLESNNISSFFIEKCLKYSDRVVMIMPKNVLNAPEFNLTREYINRFCINTIIDFGEFGFRGVLIETVCLSIDTNSTKNKTIVKSLPLDISKIQNQSYITSKTYPYWLIYRNDYFDNFVSNLHLDVFTVFRDRQITKTNTVSSIGNGNIRVLKSRNITDDGKIVNINNYDTYIEKTKLNQFSISKFIDNENVYLTPNMTYKTRLIKKPKNTIANGSLALLIPKFKKTLTKDDLLYFSSKEYREYMQIARNHQTRTLNVDSNSVFFYGIKKN
jgi:DNA (cytosine-5)-methyltransferase 1